MKIFVILLFVAIAATQVLSLDADQEWKDFKAKYNKSYPDPKEDAMRKEIFLKNLKRVQEHNAKYERGEVSYKQAINKFADLTEKEIKEQLG